MQKPAPKHTWQLLAEFPLAAPEPGDPVRDGAVTILIKAVGEALPELSRKSLSRLQATLAERIRRAGGGANPAGGAVSVRVRILVDRNADRSKPGWGFFIVEKGHSVPLTQDWIDVFFYADGNHEANGEVSR